MEVPEVGKGAMTGVMTGVLLEAMQPGAMMTGEGMTGGTVGALADLHLTEAMIGVAMVLLNMTEAMTAMVVAHHHTVGMTEVSMGAEGMAESLLGSLLGTPGSQAMAQTEAMAVAAMLSQPMVLSEGHPTVLAMLAGVAVLLGMIGHMMTEAMVVEMRIAVGVLQHKSGKELTLAQALKGTMQDRQHGHQALMTDH